MPHTPKTPPRWRFLHSLRIVLAGLFRRSREERDMADELQFHLEHRTEALMRTGLARDEAERRARLEFGAIEAYKDRCRDARGWRLGDELRSDGRYAWRMLRKNPGFSFVAIATLAIGIGVNAAIFSIVNGVLLRPLPYPEPDRIVRIYESGLQFEGLSSVSYPNFLDWERSQQSFTHMAATASLDVNLGLNGDVEHVNGVYGSAGLLGVLGLPPELGRTFTREEDTTTGAHVALISYGFWQKHFAGRPDAIGQKLTVDTDTYTIIGVLPRGFEIRRADLMLPLAQRHNPAMQQREFHPGLRAFARLKPGVTFDQARTDLEGVARGLAEQYPKSNKGMGVIMMPLLESIVGDARPTLFLLLGAVGLVLLIACANVANLLLSRAENRRRELAVRAALGAGTARLIRQLVAESVLLSLIGGTFGLLLAMLGTQALLKQLPVTLPRAQDVGVDWRVAAFTFAASLLTGLVFGLAPALHGTRIDVQGALKASARSVMGGHSRTRSTLVIVQLALGLVLLASTGLLLRTLWQLGRVDPGFDLQHVTTMRVGLPALSSAEPQRIKQTLREMLDRVRQIPGIEGVSFTDILPLSGDDEQLGYWTGSQMPDPGHMPIALMYPTTPDHFNALKIPLLAGRAFTWDDGRRAMPAIVVDEVLAQHTFPGQNPIGQTISLQMLGKVEIVGVARHIKHWGLDSDDRAKVREQMYLSMANIPDSFMKTLAAVGEILIIRSRLDGSQLQPLVRAEIQKVAGTPALYQMQTLEDVAAEGTARQRFLTIVLGLFAIIAIVLAAIGVYGVMAYSVSQRVQEIGIRMALGASARQVFDHIVGQGFRLVAVGVLVGIIAAVLATRWLGSVLYGVSPTDPLTFAAVALLLVVVALAAWGGRAPPPGGGGPPPRGADRADDGAATGVGKQARTGCRRP
jgi:predicted permease